MASNCCDSDALALAQSKTQCTPTAYCPPCVETLEIALTALTDANTARIEAIEEGTSDALLAFWLYNFYE